MSLIPLIEQVRKMTAARPGPILVAVPDEVVEPLRKHPGLPRRAEVGSHDEVIAGPERTDVRGLVVLAPWPDDEVIENYAQCLTGSAVPADLVETMAAVRYQLREAVVLRINARVYGDEPRAAGNDLHILLLTDEPLDIPSEWEDETP